MVEIQPRISTKKIHQRSEDRAMVEIPYRISTIGCDHRGFNRATACSKARIRPRGDANLPVGLQLNRVTLTHQHFEWRRLLLEETTADHFLVVALEGIEGLSFRDQPEIA